MIAGCLGQDTKKTAFVKDPETLVTRNSSGVRVSADTHVGGLMEHIISKSRSINSRDLYFLKMEDIERKSQSELDEPYRQERSCPITISLSGQLRG